jgi:release factor glutamine methyltransferase
VETDALRDMIRRRGRREPLQHIVGSTSFCGLEIAVNRHVLVPRPETELVAEFGWKFLNQLSEGRVPQTPNLNDKSEFRDSQSSPLRALDLGTGSGCIAIALAVKCPTTKIIATDISADALALAGQNAARHGVMERIQFLQSDGFAVLSDEARFDLIISNPPYISSAEIATLQPEVRDFDPCIALDGGTDGLGFYRLIVSHAAPFLKTGGKVMLEFGDGHAEAIRKIFEKEKWIVESIEQDYSHQPRILVARR